MKDGPQDVGNLGTDIFAQRLEIKSDVGTGPQREDRARDVLEFCCLRFSANETIGARAGGREARFFETREPRFPPGTALPAEWRRELEALAQKLGYRTRKAGDIEAEFAAVVQRIVTPVEGA